MPRSWLCSTVSRRAASVLCALVLVSSAAIGAASPATAATPIPRTPTGLPRSIEPLADYVGQVSCDPVVRPGTRALANLLATTYRSQGGAGWSSAYACGTDGSRSEHYEGRAIDWMVDVHNTQQHAAALAVLSWLLGTDHAGNRFAMARRLGVMYVIYDNRMWGAWDGKWEEYNGCAHLPQRASDNACHPTHMHISLSWNGAFGRTSFWTKHVPATDYGPCRPRDLNWSYRYTSVNTRPCAQYPAVHAAARASTTKQALVRYSGAAVRWQWRGPAVTAVQRALHVSATGVYGTATWKAVHAFQARHRGCPVTGSMNPPTWRALLAVVG
jgi:peptidoglycan hydrolase-like protein with peptidoglycan-binding domain